MRTLLLFTDCVIFILLNELVLYIFNDTIFVDIMYSKFLSLVFILFLIYNTIPNMLVKYQL